MNMKEEMRGCWNTLLMTEHDFGVEKRIIIKNMNKLITLLKIYKQSGSHPAVVSFLIFHLWLNTFHDIIEIMNLIYGAKIQPLNVPQLVIL